jgi:hypothetical protein
VQNHLSCFEFYLCNEAGPLSGESPGLGLPPTACFEGPKTAKARPPQTARTHSRLSLLLQVAAERLARLRPVPSPEAKLAKSPGLPAATLSYPRRPGEHDRTRARPHLSTVDEQPATDGEAKHNISALNTFVDQHTRVFQGPVHGIRREIGINNIDCTILVALEDPINVVYAEFPPDAIKPDGRAVGGLICAYCRIPCNASMD